LASRIHSLEIEERFQVQTILLEENYIQRVAIIVFGCFSIQFGRGKSTITPIDDNGCSIRLTGNKVARSDTSRSIDECVQIRDTRTLMGGEKTQGFLPVLLQRRHQPWQINDE